MIQLTALILIFQCIQLFVICDELIGSLGDRNPKYIMFCSQITYISSHTLNSLSPNIAPSCGLILDRTIYACDWEDSTNMTGWACVMIYEG